MAVAVQFVMSPPLGAFEGDAMPELMEADALEDDAADAAAAVTGGCAAGASAQSESGCESEGSSRATHSTLFFPGLPRAAADTPPLFKNAPSAASSSLLTPTTAALPNGLFTPLSPAVVSLQSFYPSPQAAALGAGAPFPNVFPPQAVDSPQMQSFLMANPTGGCAPTLIQLQASQLQPQPQRQHVHVQQAPQQVVFVGPPQAAVPPAPAAPAKEHVLESAVCATPDGLALMYAATRTNMRISWRNTLWSHQTLLAERFGSALPRFFRDNYADRSPMSEPLLHNNYPAGSRVYFQTRFSPNHCVCHHLVQLFEAYSITAAGAPDPIGMQALWIAPSHGSQRIYGYVKFADSRMAAAAVAGLKQRRKQGGRADPPHAPSETAVDTLTKAALAMSPPLNIPTRDLPATYMMWPAKALALARVMHAFQERLSHHRHLQSRQVQQAVAEVQAACRSTFGDGVVTQSVVDATVLQRFCPHQPHAPSSTEPIMLEDISLANEQRPGHHSKGH